MEPMRPQEALADAITRCAMSGTGYLILNSDREIIWTIEGDTKVDADDLTYPVIVHMRGGAVTEESIVLLVPTVTA